HNTRRAATGRRVSRGGYSQGCGTARTRAAGGKPRRVDAGRTAGALPAEQAGGRRPPRRTAPAGGGDFPDRSAVGYNLTFCVWRAFPVTDAPLRVPTNTPCRGAACCAPTAQIRLKQAEGMPLPTGTKAATA